MKQETTVTYEQTERYHKTGYIVQACPVCATNWDFKVNNRILQCCCGCWLTDSGAKGKLKRVG